MLVVLVVVLLSSGCGESAGTSAAESPTVDAERTADWSGVGAGRRYAQGAAVAWTGDSLFVYGGVRHDATARPIVETTGSTYRPGDGAWHQLPAAPGGEPLFGATALASDGQVLLVGTRCDPATASLAGADDADEPGCQPGSPAALVYDLAKQEWRELLVPDWLAGEEAGLSTVSYLRPLGSLDGRGYLASNRLLVAFDFASGRFESIDRALTLDACTTSATMLVTKQVEGHGPTSYSFAGDSSERRPLREVGPVSEFSVQGCWQDGAIRVSQIDDSNPVRSQCVSRDDSAWSRCSALPDGFGIPLTVAAVDSRVLAWSFDEAGVVAASYDPGGDTWTRLADGGPATDLIAPPTNVIDVGNGAILALSVDDGPGTSGFRFVAAAFL